MDAGGAEEFRKGLEQDQGLETEAVREAGKADGDPPAPEKIADGVATANPKPCTFRVGRIRAFAFRCGRR
jgi:hypothetical protein